MPASAAAAPVTVLGPGGRTHAAVDPYLAPADELPPFAAAGGVARRPVRPSARVASRRTVVGELRRLRRAGQLDARSYAADRAIYDRARATAARLRGTPRSELYAVIANVEAIAAGGGLTASRAAALFLTLQRNRQWWTTGHPLVYGSRVEFAGSGLVWQYYPGQGIELQMLANFGKANGLWKYHLHGELRRLLDELLPLAARRGGGMAWEYYFHFDGGVPPWTSALSQGTAIQALERSARMLHHRPYLDAARSALRIFELPPPLGVRVRTRHGSRYLIYSFDPGQRVLNAFIQALNGLYDMAHATHDRRAQRLFAAGDADARAETPSYDTGAWSLYEPGQESDLSYHVLLRDFLSGLCARTHAAVYCRTAQRFTADLSQPPRTTLRTHRVVAGRPAGLRFSLSKISRVGIVISCSGRTVLATSAQFPYGTRTVRWRAPRGPARCMVTLAARDLNNNFARSTGTLDVTGR